MPSFCQWLQQAANNLVHNRVSHTGHISSVLFQALEKFEKPSPNPHERFLLMMCNSPPDDWTGPIPPLSASETAPSLVSPFSTAAAISLCRERNVGLSIWSTRDLYQLDQMCQQSVIEVTPPSFHQVPRSPSRAPVTLLIDLSFIVEYHCLPSGLVSSNGKAPAEMVHLSADLQLEHLPKCTPTTCSSSTGPNISSSITAPVAYMQRSPRRFGKTVSKTARTISFISSRWIRNHRIIPTWLAH